MEAVLKFNLPDDKDEFTAAIKGKDYWLALWDIYSYLRQLWKYGEEENVSIEEVYNKFFEILEDRNVSIDDLS